MSDLRGLAVVAVGLLGVGVACYWGLLFALQRAVLYPRPIAAGGTAHLERAGGEQLWLAAPAGRVEAWLLPAVARAEARHPLVVFAHGNGELIDHWVDELARLREWGLAVLLVEYPGYGRSAGSPSQASIEQAMTLAYDLAVARADVDADRIVGYGRSLGGGAVCALSRERRLAALVLESTFTSVRSMARRFGLPRFLVRDPFDNEAAVRAFAGPILLVHGERDEIVGPEHARALHAAARGSELHLVRCGHNDCPRPWDALRKFFADHRLL
jgi:fermentation-respiration switch protein FrsA (DUF1100 family)